MPKAILEFNLPEEREEYQTAVKGINYYCALWDFSQDFLRAKRKYAELSKEQEAFLEETAEAFFKACENHDVVL